jgi:hypothetical protein
MNRMHRLIALVVSFSLLLLTSSSITAQETTSSDPTITAAGLGNIPDLPAGSGFIRLMRVTLQPRGSLPWNVGRQQATAGFVVDGNVAIHFEYDAVGYPLEGESVPIAPGSVVNAIASDGFFAGKDTTFTLLNVYSKPVVIVLGTVEPDAWVPAQPVSRFINFDLVQTELLGVGAISAFQAGSSGLVVARASYEPGQGDVEATPNGGPTVAYVEAGEFTYRLASGTVEWTPATTSATPVAAQTVRPGTTVTLREGDAVVEQGASTLVRNDSAAPAVVFVLVLVPTAE